MGTFFNTDDMIKLASEAEANTIGKMFNNALSYADIQNAQEALSKMISTGLESKAGWPVVKAEALGDRYVRGLYSFFPGAIFLKQNTNGTQSIVIISNNGD